jgi:hypothetical protein
VHVRVLDEGDHAIAIELGFVQPARLGAQLPTRLGQHGRELFGQRFSRPRGHQTLRLKPFAGQRACGHLVQRQPAQHGMALRKHRFIAGKAVLVLDQQPLLGGGGTYQREGAFELLAPQQHAELALGQSFAQALLRQLAIGEQVLLLVIRGVHAAIPDDHMAGPVFFFRDLTLEGGVVERVILDFHCQTLVAQLQGWPLRHRPGFEHPVDLQPKVIMHAPRRMLLDHEHQRPRARRRQLGTGLAGAREFALGRIGVEGAFHASRPLAHAAMP